MKVLASESPFKADMEKDVITTSKPKAKYNIGDVVYAVSVFSRMDNNYKQPDNVYMSVVNAAIQAVNYRCLPIKDDSDNQKTRWEICYTVNNTVIPESHVCSTYKGLISRLNIHEESDNGTNNGTDSGTNEDEDFLGFGKRSDFTSNFNWWKKEEGELKKEVWYANVFSKNSSIRLDRILDAEVEDDGFSTKPCLRAVIKTLVITVELLFKEGKIEFNSYNQKPYRNTNASKLLSDRIDTWRSDLHLYDCSNLKGIINCIEACYKWFSRDMEIYER